MSALPITLITGLPGSGKTAKAVDMMAFGEFKGLPIFSMGIPDLQIDHNPCPPVNEWTEERKAPEDPTKSLYYFAFPPQSVVFVDEAQRIYRPRSAASRVPPEVAAFETCRHTGVRFVLLTQHPNLIDTNIRRLVGRHIHIRQTPLGTYVYQWVGIGDPESKSSREQAARSRYKPPKRVFSLYKSAEVHTKTKVKIPGYVYLFVFSLIAVVGLGSFIYQRIKTQISPADVSSKLQPGTTTSSDNQPARSPSSQAPQTPQEYVDLYKPRITGLMHTAPAYDSLTQPQEAPIPVGCIERPKTGDCKCYDQQGNRYRTTPQVCKMILTEGIFFAFKPSVHAAVSTGTPEPQKIAQNEPQRFVGIIAAPASQALESPKATR